MGHYGEAQEVFEEALSKDVDHPDSVTTKQLRLDPTWELDGFWKAVAALIWDNGIGRGDISRNTRKGSQNRRGHILGRAMFLVVAAENQKFYQQVGSLFMHLEIGIYPDPPSMNSIGNW